MNLLRVQSPAPISDSELRALLLDYRRENWRGIQPPAMQEGIVAEILRSDCDSVLRQVAPYFKPSFGARVLDIGSGAGSFVVGCRSRGLFAYGIEPDRIGRGGQLTAIQIASRRLRDQAFVVGVGESLPFPDASFDLVTMNQVIEHVADQSTVLREATRVVRPGGAVYVACPNYLRCYEPHYKIFWLPLMPKRFGQWYLQLRGRDPVMLDQLTYTTNHSLRALLKALGPEYKIIDLHREEFLRKRNAGSFASRWARIVSKMTRLPLLGTIFLELVLLLLCMREVGCEMVIVRELNAQAPSC